MKKIFVLKPNENWIVDRIADEFCEYSSHVARTTPFDCDVIWLAAPWCWNQIHPDVLRERRVVCSIHHEVPDKFIGNRAHEFAMRDKIVDHYIVPCDATYDFVSKYTSKPITKIGYWWNKNLWYPPTDVERTEYRRNLGIEEDEYVIGSFQRDTEGGDLATPKLEKGPDVFCDYVKMLSALSEKKIHVLLGGWRRQYVMNRLSVDGIKFTYKELPSTEEIRMMYAVCDVYVSASRFEGGPQCLFEAPAVGTNIISSNVGMASDCLISKSIINDFYEENWFKCFTDDDLGGNIEKIQSFEIDKHMAVYDIFFEGI